MDRRLLPVAVTLAMLLVGWALTSSKAQAVERRSPRDLFYNYYVPPGDAGGVGAKLTFAPGRRRRWSGTPTSPTSR